MDLNPVAQCPSGLARERGFVAPLGDPDVDDVLDHVESQRVAGPLLGRGRKSTDRGVDREGVLDLPADDLITRVRVRIVAL